MRRREDGWYSILYISGHPIGGRYVCSNSDFHTDLGRANADARGTPRKRYSLLADDLQSVLGDDDFRVHQFGSCSQQRISPHQRFVSPKLSPLISPTFFKETDIAFGFTFGFTFGG